MKDNKIHKALVNKLKQRKAMRERDLIIVGLKIGLLSGKPVSNE